jgi:hypothetical protein
MESRDLLVTPVTIILIYFLAYLIRPMMTDEVNRKYFFLALNVRVIGALVLGMLYQFYYGGGDTFNFHTHGSRHIWEAFWDSPSEGIQLLIGNENNARGVYKYTSRIPFFHDHSSYMVIRIAAFFDLFTFSTYSATAVCFALVGFLGSWMLFLSFYEDRPHLIRKIALATLFIPSVFFWGSGLLKDTITLAALGFATYFIRKMVLKRRIKIVHVILLLFVLYITYSIKKYILLCYLPAVLLWIYATVFSRVKSLMLQVMIFPLVVVVAGASGFFAILQVSKDDPRYALRYLGKTAMVTANDIAYQTGRDAGSTYSLGVLDGSFGSMVRLGPQAINVSLFRPYLWEVRNPLMLMSALESLFMFYITLYVLYKSRGFFIRTLFTPDIIFCLMFSITFAFAVGVSTFNFGTLSRYKIPLLPFYLLAMLFIYDEAKRERNLSELASTEY